MPAQENAAVARELTEAFDTKDMGPLDALIADDVIWHEIGRSEPRHGKEALRAAAPGSGADYEITGRLHTSSRATTMPSPWSRPRLPGPARP